MQVVHLAHPHHTHQMTKLSRILVLCTLVAPTIPRPIAAQQTDSLFPHRGTWGAELAPLTTGGALLWFSSARSAWIGGLDLSFSHSNLPTPDEIITATSSSTTTLRAQLGHRWYRSVAGDNGRHLRPTVGLGVAGTMSRLDIADRLQYAWTAGGYGEVGAAWFFSPHISLGAVSMLQATMGRQRQTATTIGPNLQPIQTTQTISVWSVSANLARVLAAVYF
jgi:hypothetical protein